VYYYPGMWAWDRAVVMPIVHQALDRALRNAAPADAAPGHRLLDRYAAWAPAEDRFTPVVVAAEIEVNVPDPLIGDRELATDDGMPVTYATHIDGVVFDEDEEQPLLLSHQVGAGPAADPIFLTLEERRLAAAWAYGQSTLDRRIAGIVVNEVRLDGDGTPFRRTHLVVGATEIELAGRQLGREVLDMLDAGLWLYPNPTEDGCARCAFTGPCRAMRLGEDADMLLRTGFRTRPLNDQVEGRLGGRTWSMGRGARPRRWGEQD